MKASIVLFFVLVFALCTIPTGAQGAARAASGINDATTSLLALAKQVKNIDTSVIPALKKRETDLSTTTDALSGEIKVFSAKYTDFLTRVNAHSDAVKGHNAAKPDSHCKSCVKAYNEEADRLDAETASLAQEGATLDAVKAGLKKRFNQLTQDSADLETDTKKTADDRAALIQKAQDVFAKMQPLLTVYAGCMDKYPRDGDQALKHDCGSVAFDNVRETIRGLMDKKTPTPGTTGKS